MEALTAATPKVGNTTNSEFPSLCRQNRAGQKPEIGNMNAHSAFLPKTEGGELRFLDMFCMFGSPDKNNNKQIWTSTASVSQHFYQKLKLNCHDGKHYESRRRRRNKHKQSSIKTRSPKPDAKGLPPRGGMRICTVD